MSSGSERHGSLRLGTVAGGLIGLGLCAWLLASYGIVRIVDVLAHAGWTGTAVIIAFHFPQMLCSAFGWRVIVGSGGPGAARPGLGAYLRLRWIREAVNNLLPLAQIGGELVVVRLLQLRAVPLAAAIAGTTADLTLEIATQVLFTLLGVLLLFQAGADSALATMILESLLVAALLIVALFVALWLGLAVVIERSLLRLGRSFGWPATARIGGLHAALMRCYRAPGRVLGASFWHLLSWLLGGLEVCLILHFLGEDVDLTTGLILESLGQAAKALGFAVPGAVGVQEGGYVVIARVLGISPELALALSLMKRLREVVLGLPGLALWHRAEARVAVAPTASIT
ncbi:MAG TPA: flippase-like domain-containing protein [Steroidobacteraceae bacterium]|nr:flippase-like domain-containing protein [Steroidobacteraceae bacterium]